MANLALFYDAPTMTADDSVKTRYDRPNAKAGQSSGAPWLMAYLREHAEPIAWYRQLVRGRWEWTQTPSPDAATVNPYSLRTLQTRAGLGRDVPTGSVIEFAEERHVQAA